MGSTRDGSSLFLIFGRKRFIFISLIVIRYGFIEWFISYSKSLGYVS